MMNSYQSKTEANGQKLRGGYYTPEKLSNFLVKWALREKPYRILEPSCGDGNFVAAILEHFKNGSVKNGKAPSEIVAIEIEENEIKKAKKRAEKYESEDMNVIWIPDDFFVAYKDLKEQTKFNVILGNPPFIRFQYFDDKSQQIAFSHLREAGYHPTKLANAWAAFIQLSIELLAEGGRLAMIVPAELLQVKYAGELRNRLARQFEHIILIGFKKLVFPEIQQETLLLLADGKRSNNNVVSDIHIIEIHDESELADLDYLNTAVAHNPSKHSRNGMKWTSLFLSDPSFEALDEAEQADGLVSLGALATINVGVVTGQNKFFIVSKGFREDIGKSCLTVPVIGKTSFLKSTILKQEDFDLYARQYPAYLLNLNGVDENEFPRTLKEHLKMGEIANVHKGFKCRIRDRWYDVPSIYTPDAFLYRQIHKFPLLIMNETQTTSTDTIHRVRFNEGVDGKILATVFYNSLTLAWAEVVGRSYGGGVLELEPREADELPIPYSQYMTIDVEKVDTLLRAGKEIEALDYVDEFTLKGFLGFDNFMIRNIRNAWIELRERRNNRRK